MTVARTITAKADPFQRIPEFKIRKGKAAGQVLKEGDFFRLLPEPGLSFRFKYHVVTPSGTQYVSAYGGSKDPNGANQWRSWGLDTPFIPVKTPAAKVRA